MNDKPQFDIRRITPEALLALGTPFLAYIRPIAVDGRTGFAVHAANGERLGVFSDRIVAMAAARQHDLEPVSVH
ncbi:MAG: DUF1150 family protein [Alphaproteobacteria bacterium]|nr:DUF1150 family protein [Alphaproteobacteria bacterium]